MLSNPFYYGHFRYGGEVQEGKHKAIIEKRLFDRVQNVLLRRSKPQRSTNEPQALCKLLRCATCNMSVTAEKKMKHQKNGNVHEYVYYRCTLKHKTIHCTEPAITQPTLTAQLTDILQGYVLPKEWATELERHCLLTMNARQNKVLVSLSLTLKTRLRAYRASSSDF